MVTTKKKPSKRLRRVQRLLAGKAQSFRTHQKIIGDVTEAMWKTTSDVGRKVLGEFVANVGGAMIARAVGDDGANFMAMAVSDPLVRLVNTINTVAQANNVPPEAIVQSLISRLEAPAN